MGGGGGGHGLPLVLDKSKLILHFQMIQYVPFVGHILIRTVVVVVVFLATVHIDLVHDVLRTVKPILINQIYFFIELDSVITLLFVSVIGLMKMCICVKLMRRNSESKSGESIIFIAVCDNESRNE